jgi:hypothetical protein
LPLDCSHGSVLHIADFESEGFDAKDKFVFIVGTQGPNAVLAFVITSQNKYLKSHSKEIVVLPQGSVGFLPRESYIQCYSMHKLDLNDLRARHERGFVQNRGQLGKDVLERVLDVVADSELLPAVEIQEVFAVLKDVKF